MLLGVLGWHDNCRYLMDEPGWELWVDYLEFNPWYAPIEDEE